MTLRRRTVAAALTAPPIGVAVSFVFVILLLDLYEDLGPRGVARFFGNFMMIGSAVAYGVELVVAVPVAALLRRRNRLNVLTTVAVGALSGVVAFLPVLRVMSGSAAALAGTMLIGVVGGTCAGAWFWLIALRPGGSVEQDTRAQSGIESEPSAP